eukprot:TRINITY_DN7937_c0_g1_i1.p1 TRINITY_DN7937_c0_g1~~TRINITY_DN7937_c0_g1_i1.p1  ORF type:complete len:137 (+),score=34.07 TRINITY_DN7937_c0_g1_i1:64-474(+)
MAIRGPLGVPYDPTQSLKHVTEVQLLSVARMLSEKDILKTPPHVLSAALASLTPERVKELCKTVRAANKERDVTILLSACEGTSSTLKNSVSEEQILAAAEEIGVTVDDNGFELSQIDEVLCEERCRQLREAEEAL